MRSPAAYFHNACDADRQLIIMIILFLILLALVCLLRENLRRELAATGAVNVSRSDAIMHGVQNRYTV